MLHKIAQFFLSLITASRLFLRQSWYCKWNIYVQNSLLPFSCTRLVHTGPRVIWTSQKTIFDEQNWSQFFCNLNSPKDFTCPSYKFRIEFTSRIAKSTSPRLSDMTFFGSRQAFSVPTFGSVYKMYTSVKQTFGSVLLVSMIILKRSDDIWVAICFLVEKEVNELFEELLKDVSITGTWCICIN